MIGAVDRQKRVFGKRPCRQKVFEQMLQDGSREWTKL
jgi:hypothetical protein